METITEPRKLLTPIYVRIAQKRYLSKPEVKARIREQHKLRERILKLNPEYRELANQRSRESWRRRQDKIKAENLAKIILS
jgi:hypothetical protein